jgi:hypothetical protein
MQRLAIGSLLLVLALLPWGFPVPSHPSAAPLVVPEALPEDVLLARLTERIDLAGFHDPRTTLQDALDYFQTVHGLPIGFDERGFTQTTAGDLRAMHIADREPVRPRKGVLLSEALRALLRKVPIEESTGLTFVVRRDRIEITTNETLARQTWGSERAARGLRCVHASPVPRPVGELFRDLAEQGDCHLIVDPRASERLRTSVALRLRNTPLDVAVLLVAEQADLGAALLDNVLYVTTPERAAALAQRLRGERGITPPRRPSRPALSFVR